ncbi:MAG: S41 family peptidase [Streptosporangiaceae bacterium]
MIAPGYLRFPHISGDLISFTADDDVWLAPVAGGRAWRLTADRANVAGPRIAPDGAFIAWTSWRDGPAEIYLAPVSGGQPARVSYWSDRGTRVRGWTPSGDLLATTSAGLPFGHETWAYEIPVGDGAGRFSGHRRLPLGPVEDLAVGAAATALLTGAYQDPAFWKRYRGGTAGRLWTGPAGLAPADATGAGAPAGFRRVLAGLPAQFACPMLVGGRLAFISDHEGIGNLYSCAIDGTDLRRHTDHDEFYVRNASTDGLRVIYQCAGDLWLLGDLGADTPAVRLEVTLGSPVTGRAPRLISAADHLADLSCDQTGQASAIQVRGTVHWLTHRDGPARALSVIPGPTARLPRVLGDTGQVAWVVAGDDAEALQIAPADGSGSTAGQYPRTIAAGQIGWVFDLAAAPDGRTVAVAARDGRLLAVDVATGSVREITRSAEGPVSGLAFAPDSAWLAWSHPGPGPLSRLRVTRVGDPDAPVTDLTDGRFADSDPAFTADGKFLAFLSRRTFDPVYDAHVFDLSFPYGSRPFLLALAASTPSPFGPLPAGRPAGGDKPGDVAGHDGAPGGAGTGAGAGAAAGGQSGDAAAGQAGQTAQPQPVRIDLDQIADRIIQVPVPEARYASLHAVDGGLAWLRVPLTGNLGEGGARLEDDQPRPALEHFDLGRARCTELIGQVDWFVPSGDGHWLVVRDKDQLVVVPASRKADPENADDRIGVDLSRARYLADPAALWRAAYAEAGRAMRHEFWIEDMAEVDWDGVLEQYRPLLDRIATASDFADLLHEVVAELGSSHAYVDPAGSRDSTGQVAGLLGADLAAGPDGWRIARILPGESSDPRARSPLGAPGTGIGSGDLLLAVDGQPVDPVAGPGPLLVGAAGKPVELTVAAGPGAERRRAVVVPLASDLRLRYQDWVAGRRRLVRELGGGRIGYLHVPDMVSEGWSDFHRDLRTEMRMAALIIDVRANRGGHTSQLVIEKLARRVIGWDLPRRGSAESYPGDAPLGPVVAIADENAGSDGDIVTAAIQMLGIGPVVGARTWGGVIGIEGWHELVDGTSMTMPKYSFWFSRFGWGVENHGVDPDVEVIISPDDWAADRDVQLERAVRIALESLAERPAHTPPSRADRPSRHRPALPPRQPAG